MLTALLIFFPLVVSIVVLAFKPAQAKSLAFIGALLELAISVYVVFQFDKTIIDKFNFDKAWISSLGINFSVGIDGISLLLVLLTTVLIPLYYV